MKEERIFCVSDGDGNLSTGSRQALLLLIKKRYSEQQDFFTRKKQKSNAQQFIVKSELLTYKSQIT